MMYILEKRLIAQSIPPEKAEKVIADIVRTMYNPKFLQELFKPQVCNGSKNTFFSSGRLTLAQIIVPPSAGFVFKLSYETDL